MDTIPQPGDIIASLRIKKRVDQKTFAHQLGVSASYLSQIERGHKRISLRLYKKIADALNIPFGKFIVEVFRGHFPNDSETSQVLEKCERLLELMLNVLLYEEC